MNESKLQKFNRRCLLKLGAGSLVGSQLFRPAGAFGEVTNPCGGPIEVFPNSPLIGGTGYDSHGKAVGSAFTEPLPIPMAARPVPQSEWSKWLNQPGPGLGQQDSDGGTHQIWPSSIRWNSAPLPNPIVYKIKMLCREHSLSGLRVQPIDKGGNAVVPPYPVSGTGPWYLPKSTIYGFNGTFPGARINAEYGKPCLLRFENCLDGYNDPDYKPMEHCNFGAPDYSFLTHLHNGHTAPESDGQPHYRYKQVPWRGAGYQPGEWVDNLYLNWPAGGDFKEMQSFFWFHDHKMDHTGANVYKGMVGLYPIYDPKQDSGDETTGYRLPGVRTNNPDGSFDVAYDIPLAFYDCRLDDGVTQHQDAHNGCGETRPEWWGRTFFRHFPSQGFVGDVFTVNGKAYPVLNVDRRKYRLRFLDCSISRCYDFKLMKSSTSPVSAASMGYGGTELQGQYRLPNGTQCMKFVQIATDGGLIPTPLVRDNFELWPAKRREFVVDFTRYMDGSPTKPGDVIYLVNIMKMSTGLKPDSFDPNYKVPVLKIVIGDLPAKPDQSLMPTALRPLPVYPYGDWKKDVAAAPVFELQHSGGGETQWQINGKPFDPTVSMWSQPKNSYNVWRIRNGGGGWVHPLHLHMEEHRVVGRNGINNVPDARHPDDVSKEDVIALDPSEEVIICRHFRDFTGPYVAHCHNLAHEDHAMMWGWTITP